MMKPISSLFCGALALGLPYFTVEAQLGDAYIYVAASRDVILRDWVDLVTISAHSKNATLVVSAHTDTRSLTALILLFHLHSFVDQLIVLWYYYKRLVMKH